MRLSHILTSCLLACVTVLPLGAKPGYNQWNRDFGIILGANLPMNKYAEGDLITGITYGQFGQSGVGFRAGIQFTPNTAKAGNSVGVPVRFAYRTGLNSHRRHWGRGTSREGFGSFLSTLFNDTELTLGLTPGYVAGGYTTEKTSYQTEAGIDYWQKHWTECQNHFSFSVDAGACLNFNVWKFDFKVIPAFHYNLTDNYLIHYAEGNSRDGETASSVKPIKWFFSIAGGLVFKF